MLGPSSPIPRALRQFAVVALIAVLVVLAGPANPAFAHAELLSSDPGPGAVLDTSPTAITLTFDEAVEVDLGAVRVFDGNGEPIEVAAARHPAGQDSVVTVPLPVLPVGSYVVSWQVVSADSHPASGAFTFQIGANSTLAPDVLGEVTTSAQTNGTAGFLVGVTRVVVISGIILVGGILAAIALGAVEPSRRRRLTVQLAAFLGGLAGLLAIPLETAYVRGLGLGAITDGDAWRSLIDTRIGTSWLVRAIVLYFGGLGLSVTARHHMAGWWRSAVIALLLALGAASAYGGHGATGRWVFVGIDATVVHVAAMAVWIGGLVAVLLGPGDLTLQGIRRYSDAAIVAVVAVVLSGSVQGIRQLRTASALIHTDYGRLLLAKVAGVAVVLGVAIVSRTVVHGRPFTRRQLAPVGAAPDLDRNALRRSVRAEVVVASVIIVLTSWIMGENPTATAAPGPFSATVVNQDYLASITVDPAGVGITQVHIYLSSPGGSLSKPDSVTASITDPSKGIAPIGLTLLPVGANHYQAVDAVLPYAATWTITIRAVYNTFDEIVFTTEVKVA